MASKAKAIIVLLIAWGVMGLIWGGLNDIITTYIPANFAYAIADAADTWNIIKYIWLIGMPLIAIGTGLAAVSQKGGEGLGRAIVANAMVMTVWFMMIFFWACLYQPMTQTIPNTFEVIGASALPAATIKTLYNTGVVLLIVGFGLIGVSIEI